MTFAYGIPEIVDTVRAGRLVGLLRIVSFTPKNAIQQSWRYLVRQNCLYCRTANEQFAASMPCGPDDRPCRDLGLEYRRHGSRFARHPRLAPIELRRIESRQLDHRDRKSTRLNSSHRC